MPDKRFAAETDAPFRTEEPFSGIFSVLLDVSPVATITYQFLQSNVNQDNVNKEPLKEKSLHDIKYIP